MDSECWGESFLNQHGHHVQSVSLDFPRMKTRTIFCFLGNDWEAERKIHTRSLCYFLGLPLVNWKAFPLCESATLHMCLARMPYTCSSVSGAHRSIWQLAYCLIPGWVPGTLVTWALFSEWCDSSCGKPREWQALTALLTSGKRRAKRLRREMFSDTQQLWLDCSVKEHTTHRHPTVSRCNRRKPWFLNC